MVLRRWYRWGLLLWCCWNLWACQPVKPPLELAPNGPVVQAAIVTQLNRTQAQVSRQLQTAIPPSNVSKITVRTLDPLVVNQLPAYHLTGVYNLTLTLPRQTVTQRQNPFDLYLQRQQEGKSWRLLVREIDPQTDQLQWRSYLIDYTPPPIESPETDMG